MKKIIEVNKLLKKTGVISISLLITFTTVSFAEELKKDYITKNKKHNSEFIDIATQSGSGIDYRRTESPRDAILDQFKLPGSILEFQDVPETPGQSRGNPGVALFDYDNDGDLDIYVTNGPGTANSLYSNNSDLDKFDNDISKTSFIDVATSAGVSAIEQDSNGVCFGDIDNDGDKDLYVLGASEPNKLFENSGDGVFMDISESSQTDGGDKNSITCSFGDVNGDGLLDLVVGNLYNNFDNRLALMMPEYQHLKEHNKLFVNQGQSVFSDESHASGIESFLGASWSIAMVDYDKDGDVDIIVADDQATRPPEKVGGVDLGYIRILQNDSTGKFDDVTESVGLNIVGDWMGLSFGDLNADGNIDIFATNIGDYLAEAVGSDVGLPTGPNEWSSRWFLGKSDGTFTDPGIGNLGTTPFGWGASTVDYDNDGDLDIIYHGGADMAVLVDATNPGAILNNDGKANFTRDISSLSQSTNHTRRNVQGVATGDINNDGLIDIVSVSSMDWPDSFPLAPIVPPGVEIGGQFDDAAFIWPTFAPIDPTNIFAGFIWTHLEPVDGTLSVEINQSKHKNNWIKVKLLGTKGYLPNSQSNRDGIGAIVEFDPDSKSIQAVSKPVVSGGSHASADSLNLIFGMDDIEKGTLDVLWTGGVRNKLYNVNKSEVIMMPEIPCSYDQFYNFSAYRFCVISSLTGLERSGLIDNKFKKRLKTSAIRAYFDFKK